jgi:general secretion pathway protein D
MKSKIMILMMVWMATAWTQPPGVQRPDEPAAPQPLPVEVQPPQVAEGPVEEEMVRPQLMNTGLDLIIAELQERTGKIILKDTAVPDASLTLNAVDPMPESEYIKAIESLLGMNNIALVPFRDRFLKMVPADTVGQSGVQVGLDAEQSLVEEDRRVSRLVQLKYLELSEVQSLITGRLSASAKVQPLERNNAFLVTDSEVNILRLTRILELLDRPADVREEVKIYQLVHATASEVKASLE